MLSTDPRNDLKRPSHRALLDCAPRAAQAAGLHQHDQFANLHDHFIVDPCLAKTVDEDSDSSGRRTWQNRLSSVLVAASGNRQKFGGNANVVRLMDLMPEQGSSRCVASCRGRWAQGRPDRKERRDTACRRWWRRSRLRSAPEGGYRRCSR